MNGRCITTPPLEQYVLPGITRGVAMELAQNMGFTVVEEEIPLDRLKDFDCAFLSGTATGLRSVRSIYDQNERRVYSFSPHHNPFLELQDQFNMLIHGMEVDPRNRDLQHRVRSIKVDF